MNLKLIVLALGLGISTYTMAQDSKMIEKKATAQTDKLVKALELDDDQKMLLYRQNYVALSAEENYKAAKAKTPELDVRMEKQRESYDQAVKGILTETQYEAYSKMEMGDAKKSKTTKSEKSVK